MRIFQVVRSLFIAALLGGSLQAVESDSFWTNISWDMSPLSDPLTKKQVVFLNLYMQYAATPQMSKLPRYVKETLPLYIEFHSQELDPYAVQYFRTKQLLSAGMTFADVMALQENMRDLQLGQPLSSEQNKFLRKFVQSDVKKLPQVSLIPLVKPLFSYVNQNPNEFNKKTNDILRESLLKSVGFSPKEMYTLNSLANRPLKVAKLNDLEVQALQKWLTLASLHSAIEVYDAPQILRLQAVIHNHAQNFSPNSIAFLDNEVGNSRAVQKFRYANFQASMSQSPVQQVPVQAPFWEGVNAQQVVPVMHQQVPVMPQQMPVGQR